MSGDTGGSDALSSSSYHVSNKALVNTGMAVIVLCVQYVFLSETVLPTPPAQGKKFCSGAATDWTKSGYFPKGGPPID